MIRQNTWSHTASELYKNAMLTAIAVLIALILAELQDFRQQLPTRGDFAELRTIKSPAERRVKHDQLIAKMPVVWVDGGDIEIDGGNVTVDGHVSVEGEVSIWR